ncbi:hypothetical protein FGRMN_10703 [Fusarium graminum]|nr:hypothetical protein FGRMN_10703 [Fusarium graminum]
MAATCFILRLMAKFLQRSSWGLDDIFMLISFAFLVMEITITQLMVNRGVGAQVWIMNEKDIVEAFKLFYFHQLNYFITLGLIKASILAFYLRIFSDHRFRITAWATLSFNLVFTAVCAIVILTARLPISSHWERWREAFIGQQKMTIVGQKVLYLAHGAVSIMLDVWMVILPFTQLYHLGLKLRKKIGVIGMFSVGIFLTVASIMRFSFLVSFVFPRKGAVPDATRAIIWAFVELSVGVMVGCMPMIRQLTRKISSSLLPKRNSETTGIFRHRSLQTITLTTTADEEKSKVSHNSTQ